MDSIYCHFDNLRNFEHYERTDKRKEAKKMKIEKIESYPPLTIDEQETVLTWDAKERAWHICTDYPAHARKYEVALDESKTTKKGYRDGALVMIDGYLNENTHTVRIGKKRRYSDEQRAKMAERLKNAREKK